MVHKIFVVLGLAFFVSISQCEEKCIGNECRGRKPYDPSTVVNIYPSLEKLGGKGALLDMSPDEDDDDSDGDEICEFSKSGACAAASNVQPTFAKKADEKDPKAPAPAAPAKEEQKDSKTAKVAVKGKFMKGETNVTPHSEEAKPSLPLSANADKIRQLHDNNNDEWNKVHNWSNFQDMLQLLRKRKH